MFRDMKFKHSLIYSEKSDELAIIMHHVFDMIQMTDKDGPHDDLDSRIIFNQATPWKLIDEWYE